jgi:hypothetical protein
MDMRQTRMNTGEDASFPLTHVDIRVMIKEGGEYDLGLRNPSQVVNRRCSAGLSN